MIANIVGLILNIHRIFLEDSIAQEKAPPRKPTETCKPWCRLGDMHEDRQSKPFTEK
jgi:hypothetical protein